MQANDQAVTGAAALLQSLTTAIYANQDVTLTLQVSLRTIFLFLRTIFFVFKDDFLFLRTILVFKDDFGF